jgi:hypothetical protein
MIQDSLSDEVSRELANLIDANAPDPIISHTAGRRG